MLTSCTRREGGVEETHLIPLWSLLEMLKFGLYLIVPACTVAYFERPEVFQQIQEDESTSCFTGEDRMTLMH